MPLPDEFLQELKYRNRIEDVVENYVNLKRSGSNLKGLCPFHNEKTASFTLYPENGTFYCFGCAAGGDVITFVMQIENLDYMEAVRFLASRAGMSVPETGTADKAQARLRTRILELNREAARYYHSYLMSPGGRPYLDYLTQRGISPSTVRHFGLGAAPGSGLMRHLASKGFTEDEALSANLAFRGKRGCLDRFYNRVIYPIIDLRGNVIAFGGRILPGRDGAKYINSSDTPVFKKGGNLYSFNFAKNSKADYFILAEGYMDVISLHQAGFDSAVAALGTAFTPEQARLMARYKKSAVVALDADEAGQRGANRAISILNDAGIEVRVLKIPGAKDPDEFIRENGAERFKGLIEGASNDTEFYLMKIRDKHDVTTVDGKVAFLKEAVEVLKGVKNPIERDLYAGRLSDEFGVDKATIISQIKTAAKKSGDAERKKEQSRIINGNWRRDEINPQRSIYPRAASSEERLIKLLMLHPDLLDGVRAGITPDDFVTDFNRRVFGTVCGVIGEYGAFDISRIGGEYSPAETGRISGMMNSGLNPADARAECADLIRVIKEEKQNANKTDPSEWSDDDFINEMKRLRNNKGGNSFGER